MGKRAVSRLVHKVVSKCHALYGDRIDVVPGICAKMYEVNRGDLKASLSHAGGPEVLESMRTGLIADFVREGWTAKNAHGGILLEQGMGDIVGVVMVNPVQVPPSGRPPAMFLDASVRPASSQMDV